MSRINVKLVADEESDLNAPGPQIGTLEPFFRKLDGLTAEDTIVLAGSLPAGLPQDTYEQVFARASGARCVVDTTGDALVSVLKYRPFLIKPNHHELGELFGKELHTEEGAGRQALPLRCAQGNGTRLHRCRGFLSRRFSCGLRSGKKPRICVPHGRGRRQRERLFGRARYARGGLCASWNHIT